MVQQSIIGKRLFHSLSLSTLCISSYKSLPYWWQLRTVVLKKLCKCFMYVDSHIIMGKRYIYTPLIWVRWSRLIQFRFVSMNYCVNNTLHRSTLITIMVHALNSYLYTSKTTTKDHMFNHRGTQINMSAIISLVI